VTLLAEEKVVYIGVHVSLLTSYEDIVAILYATSAIRCSPSGDVVILATFLVHAGVDGLMTVLQILASTGPDIPLIFRGKSRKDISLS